MEELVGRTAMTLDYCHTDEKETALMKLGESICDVAVKTQKVSISSDDDYMSAAEIGRIIKQRTSEVKDYWKPIKEAAHKAHAEICEREKSMLTPLTDAEKMLKKAMSDWIELKEQKRCEAEAEAIKAAEVEAERLMCRAVQNEKDGDAISASALFEEAEMIEDISKTVVVGKNDIKAVGVSASDDWEIVNIDNSKVPCEIDGVIIRPVDTGAVMRMIRASKGTVKIQGVDYRKVNKISFRK